MARKKGKSGNAGSRKIPFHNLQQVYMKLVHSETCQVCPNRCVRGIRYLEKMSRPGAVGHGVPCILTAYSIK